MTRAERLAILGANEVAEIRQRVANLPDPPPEAIAYLRLIFAPALDEIRQRRATEHSHQVAA